MPIGSLPTIMPAQPVKPSDPNCTRGAHDLFMRCSRFSFKRRALSPSQPDTWRARPGFRRVLPTLRNDSMSETIQGPGKNRSHKPSFPTRWSHGTRLVVGSRSCAQGSRDIHETGCTRTAGVTLFLTLPPAEKVHKINEITAWLPGRREQEKAEGGKSFRESSIQTTSSQSPERGTGLRRTCRINGLGGECPNEGQKAAKQVRVRSVRVSSPRVWRGGLWPSLRCWPVWRG
jgi:hypothetical protein